MSRNFQILFIEFQQEQSRILNKKTTNYTVRK